MKDMRHASAGLGGWLWPVTWSAAVLPVLFAAITLAALAGDLVAVLRYGTIPYPLGETWMHLEIGVSLLLTAAAWWWAIRWFARDPRMPHQGPVVLLACAGLVEAVAWLDRDHAQYHVVASILLGLAIAGFIGARWSARVRNTFVVHALPSPASGWRGALFSGPRDWSQRRWLLPGAVVYAALKLWLELPTFAEAAFETIPPPSPANSADDVGGSAAALIATGHPGRYIEASRVALALTSCAVLLVAGALIGLMRGARWTPWIAFAAILLATSAPLYMSVRDWCCPFLDGPPFERMWHAWCIVISIMMLGGAFRRCPGTQQPE